MRGHKLFIRLKQKENSILAALLVLILCAIIGIRYDYYYDLNDDVVMKDILSGVYTGSPEGRNIQMLYPLGGAIALAYRLLPGIPVYGIFLCLCQFGCIWLVVRRSLDRGRSALSRVLLLGAEIIFILALLTGHLVFVQYTFTSAMLAAAAAFLFITSGQDGSETGKAAFIRKSLPCILTALLSYLFRTELMLLLLPLLCVAGVYRWSLEERVFTRENFIKYLSVMGAVLAGMAVLWGLNRAAYSSGEWKEFLRFFDSRTEVYDFQGIPPYEGNEGLYESLGMTEGEQYMLLDQYNFGLEEGLDAAMLDEISAYQAGIRQKDSSFLSLFAEKLRLSLYRTLHRSRDDSPWNLAVVLGYLWVTAAMALGVLQRCAEGETGQGRGCRIRRVMGGLAGELWKPLFLYAVRTALWLFILIRGRDPVRITHSLYLMELCILAAILQTEWGRLRTGAGSAKEKSGTACPAVFRAVCRAACPAFLTVLMAAALPERMAETDREYTAREAACLVDRGMKEYSRAHEGDFYFMDVYSSVSYPAEPYASTPYSEKLFAETDNRLGNYDLMGGWLVKSPLYKRKLERFGIPSMEEGLLYMENVYMMAELEKGTDYVRDYFADRGIEVSLIQKDRICDLIGVYKIEPAGQ